MSDHYRPWGTATHHFWTSPDPDRPAAEPAAAAVQQAPQAEARPAADAPAETGDSSPVQHQAEQAAANTGQEAVAQQPAGDAAAAALAELPPGFMERINAVTAAFGRPEDHHGLSVAGVEAEKLDQELTALFGERHTYTVNIRELRGWLAFMTGDHATATRWYLHTAGLNIGLLGPSAPQTQESVKRAIHLWQQVTDHAEIVRLGSDLASVTALVLGSDDQALRFVQGRVARHQQPPQ
ncbi:hypothetical protein E5083_30565 [Streptomyces bauhiniae]|uniref:Uncharacterized protein n=1 Tax=Streptomyces bauhiniae TaxID=2340725 RepID=A0A4Z1CTU2_9ACTN|nr:hypothetical protein [Streptomyces bauhiniae]TGN72276.1 hypothetical protein E5083_30565 [Streptomyces bauhiniae]